MTHHAAALTYYSLLSLFPALLFLVAVLSLVGQERLIAEAAGYLRQIGAPEQTIESVTTALDGAVSQRGSALGALALGLTAAVWGAAAAFGAAGTALNVVLRVQERRNLVRRKLSDLAHTVVILALAFAAFLLIFLGGALAGEVFGLLGLGETAQRLWSVARWPAALLCTLLVYAITYWAAPDAPARRLKWVSPGALGGIALWFVLTGAFFLWVENFARYSLIYGAFAAVVMLLVWIWLTNVALLLGAELNATIDERRAAHRPPASVSAAPPLPPSPPAPVTPATAERRSAGAPASV